MAIARYELNIIQDSNTNDSRPTGENLIISSRDELVEFKITGEERIICVSKKEMAWLCHSFVLSNMDTP